MKFKKKMIGAAGAVAMAGSMMVASAPAAQAADYQTPYGTSVPTDPGTFFDLANQSRNSALDLVSSGQVKSDFPYVYSNISRSLAYIHGWHHETAEFWGRKAVSLQRPDGSFPTGFDANGNSIGPSKTVTTTDHMRDVLIQGYKAGWVTKYQLSKARDYVLALPVIAKDADEHCIVYSSDAAENQSMGCVNNINASAAAFLRQINDADSSLFVTGMWNKYTFAYNYDFWKMDTTQNWWRYRELDANKWNDIDHEALNVEVHWGVWGDSYGQKAAVSIMQKPASDPYGNSTLMDTVGKLRALQYSPRTYCSSMVKPAWDEYNTFKTISDPTTRATRMGQLAMWAAKSSVACNAAGVRV